MFDLDLGVWCDIGTAIIVNGGFGVNDLFRSNITVSDYRKLGVGCIVDESEWTVALAFGVCLIGVMGIAPQHILVIALFIF